MKKASIALMFLLILLFHSNSAFAKEEKEVGIGFSSANIVHAEYNLPYPGLLPDNPLYFLKNARDVINGFFISNSFKKAEYNLLQADKRLNAGYYLFLKNNSKDKLIVTTLSKSEKYFGDAIKETLAAKDQGKDVSDFLEKIINSSQEHQEILAEIKKGISSESRAAIERGLRKSQDFQEFAKEIKAK